MDEHPPRVDLERAVVACAQAVALIAIHLDDRANRDDHVERDGEDEITEARSLAMQALALLGAGHQTGDAP